MLDDATTSEMACFLYPWLGFTTPRPQVHGNNPSPATNQLFRDFKITLHILEDEWMPTPLSPAHQNLVLKDEVT